MASSLTEAEEDLYSTHPKANFQRLTRLLMRGGVRLLRETFDSIITPSDLPLKLSDPATENDLKRAKTSQNEWKALYPSPGRYGKSADFDITLIFRLLRTICGLTPPPGPRGWDNLPNSGDHSLVADLARIKYYRNEVHGHKKTMEVSDIEFVRLWKEIREALLRIAASISPAKRDEWKKAIDDFLTNSLTPDEERYIEELDRWYKQDMDVKEKLDNIQEEVRCLRQEMQQSHRPISPVYITGPVVFQTIYLNCVNVNTQPGLPFGPQLLQETGCERVDNTAINQPGQKLKEGADGPAGELQQNQADPPSEITCWDVILSLKEPYELFKQYLRYKRHVWVRSYEVGSLLLTVECSSLQVLEGLWEDYRSGHLNAIAQEILVTAEVLEKLGLDEVKLETVISEEEYEKGKQIFAENSDLLLRISKVERENTQLRKEVEALKQTLEGDKDMREDEKCQESRKVFELGEGIIKLAKVMGSSIDELKDKVRGLEMTTPSTKTKKHTKRAISFSRRRRQQGAGSPDLESGAEAGNRFRSTEMSEVLEELNRKLALMKVEKPTSEKLTSECLRQTSETTGYKYLREIDPSTQDKIGTLLARKLFQVRDWRHIALKYGMDQRKIDSLQRNYPEAGKKTLEYLEAVIPDLTLNDFCNTLKEFKRFDILEVLQGHLSVPGSVFQV